VTITGALDHVEDAPSHAGRVARYKHGKLASDLTLRDLFYALAAEEMEQSGRRATVVRVSLSDGDVKPLNISRQRKRLEREANEALAGLASERYTPRPEARKCATCPFALICPG
jgi:CRISPR/Cas system-associated exonuclease Cas4 (RecB family)